MVMERMKIEPVSIDFDEEIKKRLDSLGIVGIYTFWFDEVVGTTMRHSYSSRGSWFAYEVSDLARLGLIQVASEFTDTFSREDDVVVVEHVPLLGKRGAVLPHMVVIVVEGRDNKNLKAIREMLREAVSQVKDESSYDDLPAIFKRIFSSFRGKEEADFSKIVEKKGDEGLVVGMEEGVELDMERLDKDFNRLFLGGLVKDSDAGWFKPLIDRVKSGSPSFREGKYPLGCSLVYGSFRKTLSSRAFSSKDFYKCGRDVSLKLLNLLDLPDKEISDDFLEGFVKRFWLNFFGTKVQTSFSRRDKGKISGVLRDEECWLCSFIKGHGEGAGLCDWSAGAIHGIFEGLGFKVLKVVESECKSSEGKACIFNVEAEDLRILKEALPAPEPLKDTDKLPDIPSPVLPNPLEE